MRLLGLNLRSTMTAAVITLAVLLLSTAAALMSLTTAMHSSGHRAEAAVESVRLMEEVQRDLLLHDRLRDRTAREQIANGVRERLRDAGPQIAGTGARAALTVADREVASYLALDGGGSEQEIATQHAAAFAAVDRLLTLELAEAREARTSVRRVDDLADVIGMVVAAFVTVSTGLLVWWLKARALHPLLGLAQTMRRFGRGDMEARANDEGPSELAEMARRFNEMASAIARQRKDRQAFIAGVVHDLRTPLSVLRMSTDLATTSATPLPPERLGKLMGTVARQVTRLERMAGDLLESVTIEAGKVTLRTEALDAREIATEVVSLYATISAKHTVELELPEKEIAMSCDRIRIEQILSNLVSNAIKYSPAGGKVALRVEARGGDVVFVVHDEGVGMSEADAAMVFEPFRRSTVLRDEVPGSGLGLFIVRRLVEAHGGCITLQTAPGEGSTFQVRIPAARARQASGRIAPPEDEEPHRVLHVPHEEEARARPPHAAARGGARQERHN